MMHTATDAAVAQRTVRLTAHPLQRVGAFALAVLGGAPDPAALTPEGFDRAVARMRDDLLATVTVDKAQEPGGFWLGISYLMWPNSKINPTKRGKQTPAERAADIREWRHMPDPTTWPDAPCALCGRPACGFYGKVDVPLRESDAHRNTTARGHAGLALCYPCLASFHALPYGCALHGGRAAAVHSFDDAFLARVVARQVRRTMQAAIATADTGAAGPYARERLALDHLRRYEHRVTEDVDLIVFTNSNRAQEIEIHSLAQPLAEWLRTTMRTPERRRGFGRLCRAHAFAKVPGSAALARQVFRDPARVLDRAVTYLRERAAALARDESPQAPDHTQPLPAATTDLTPLCFSYATEVLHMNKRDVEQIRQLAGHVADVIAPRRERGALKSYEQAHREPRDLQNWLRRQAVAWATRPEATAESFITTEQWLLLFDHDTGATRLHQDLLFIAVLEQLAARGWRVEDAEETDEGTEADAASDQFLGIPPDDAS